MSEPRYEINIQWGSKAICRRCGGGYSDPRMGPVLVLTCPECGYKQMERYPGMTRFYPARSAEVSGVAES